MKLIVTLTLAFLLIVGFVSAAPVGISSSSCAIYNDFCEDGRTALFRVSSEFFLVGGAHVAKTSFSAFNWVLCCDDIIGGSNPLFSVKDSTGLIGGDHAFPVGVSDYDIAIGNNYLINETCSSGYDCIAKVSSYSTINSFLFTNSHVWPCGISYPGLVSICYEQRNPNSLCSLSRIGQTCPSGAEIGDLGEDDLTRCVGEEDVNGYGHCCMNGQSWQNVGYGLWECVDYAECGFEEVTQPCYLPGATASNPGPLYFLSEYFANPDCFVEIGPGEFKSCCFNCYSNGYQGNYYQDVEVTILSQS